MDIFKGFEARLFTNINKFDHDMPYRIFKPEKFDDGRKFPLVIFLHGGDEAGTDNLVQVTENEGALMFANKENQKSYPCFILAPQHPEGTYWDSLIYDDVLKTYRFELGVYNSELDIVLDIIESLQKEFSIDSSRLYVVGLSDGAFGTWGLITRRPDMFAAAVPICGDGDQSKVSQFAHVPLWVFQGEDDNCISVKIQRDMIAALQGVGGQPKYTEYKGVGHNSWFEAFKEPEFLPWIFSQKNNF